VKNYVNNCEHISLRFSSTVFVAQDEGIYLFDEIVADGIAPPALPSALVWERHAKEQIEGRQGGAPGQAVLCWNWNAWPREDEQPQYSWYRPSAAARITIKI
jgi:hypothetical protein